MHLRVQNRRTSDLQVGTVKPLFCLQEFNIFKALFTWSSISSNPTVILDASCWHLPQVAERPELICHQNGLKVRPVCLNIGHVMKDLVIAGFLMQLHSWQKLHRGALRAKTDYVHVVYGLYSLHTQPSQTGFQIWFRNGVLFLIYLLM